MRAALLLALLAGCASSASQRFHVFELPKDKSDVIWLRNEDGTLRRCWQHQAGYPVCADARMLQAPALLARQPDAPRPPPPKEIPLDLPVDH